MVVVEASTAPVPAPLGLRESGRLDPNPATWLHPLPPVLAQRLDPERLVDPDGVEPVGNHDLRHSLVAIAFEHGLSAPQVALLARHANAKVTLAVYAGLIEDGREQALAKLAEGGFGA